MVSEPWKAKRVMLSPELEQEDGDRVSIDDETTGSPGETGRKRKRRRRVIGL